MPHCLTIVLCNFWAFPLFFGASAIPIHLHFLACNASTGMRLVHGNETSGLVEVYRNNCEWRSVCDDFWTDHDAKVACRQLGFLPYGMHIIAPVQYHLLSD